MRYLQNNSTDPYFNMSFDEWCLRHCPSDDVVFYLWRNAPSVIIGLNQSAYAEVNLPYLKEHGIALARRVTGGGAVYHDLQNLNYTIVGKSRDLNADYPEYLHMVVDALRQLGVPAELSGRNDIMVDGRKCSGYAKRVWKDRLMVHGTLMFDVDLETLQEVLSVPGSKMAASGIASVRSKVANLREYLPQFCDVMALKDALNRILAGADTEVPMDASKQEAIDRMADEKFRTWDWIYGKSPEAQFRASQKFACGTVEVCWSVHHGLLEDVRFSGDFLGNLPAEGLAARLNGLRYEQNSISAALNGAGVSDYFDGLSPDELTELLICC